MKRAAALLAAAGVAAGCGGADRLPVLELAQGGAGAEREAGLVVLRFVQAASAGDVGRMEALMSSETRAGFGPGAAGEVMRQLEDIRDARVVLATVAAEGWAVGAVAGRDADDDDEPTAWAAALRREGGRWRVELGGVAFARLRPGPLDESDGRAELRIEAQAGGDIASMRLWIGRSPVVAYAFRRNPFAREIWGRLREPLPPGLHTAVAFAATADTAGALAWIFEVEA